METVDPNTAKQSKYNSDLVNKNKELESAIGRIRLAAAKGDLTSILVESGGDPAWANNFQQHQPVPNPAPHQPAPNPVPQGPDPQTQALMQQLSKEVRELRAEQAANTQKSEEMQNELNFKKDLSHELQINPDHYSFFRRSTGSYAENLLKNIMENAEAQGESLSLSDALDLADRALKEEAHATLGHDNDQVEKYDRYHGLVDEEEVPAEEEPTDEPAEEEVPEKVANTKTDEEKDEMDALYGDEEKEPEAVDGDLNSEEDIVEKLSLSEEDLFGKETDQGDGAGNANAHSSNSSESGDVYSAYLDQ